jgi:hypothetical protein
MLSWARCCVLQVCFAMFMPNLLRNFLYVQHNSGCWWLDLLLRFVASELHCCANFSRKFFWSSEQPWPAAGLEAWVCKYLVKHSPAQHSTALHTTWNPSGLDSLVQNWTGSTQSSSL